MPRPELYPVKKVIGFDQQMLSAIEKWRRRQDPIPTVSDALRRLVEIGLEKTAQRRTISPVAAAKASKMAGETIDRLGDPSATTEERETCKRRLIKGPKEFRGLKPGSLK